MFLLKRFNILSQSVVPSITEKVISYSLALGQHLFIALQIKNFRENISMFLKVI